MLTSVEHSKFSACGRNEAPALAQKTGCVELGVR